MVNKEEIVTDTDKEGKLVENVLTEYQEINVNEIFC